FSEFNVGAALITKGGKIYKGCNIENSAYSPSICAERVAIFKAISEGETDFEAMAIVGGRNGVFESFCSPCGVCRQVLFEFCKDD
ncbi:MAG: cytidine deaminase, partial [Oscillospiraceae bacterium]